MIHLVNISKQYATWAGDRIVLFPTSLTIPTDRGVAVLGRNGAGKTTLLRMISGVELPDQGRVIRTVSVSWPLGYAGGISADMTGRQNVRFIARLNNADEDAAVAFVEDFAELGPYLDERVATYSSGMRGRLTFGISLAIDFDCYLIDEGTSVGDAWFVRNVRRPLPSGGGGPQGWSWYRTIRRPSGNTAMWEWCFTADISCHSPTSTKPSISTVTGDVREIADP
jgi:capsular polysaccharide transport system ATP-binding protein